MSNLDIKIAVGADHGGFPLKEEIKKHLQAKGVSVIDCGTNSTESVDYPKYAWLVAEKVSTSEAKFGIIVDGAGIGSAMTANKVSGVRAALCYDLSSARNSREHNNANVLTLGAGLIGSALAKQIVDIFISTECTAERHLRRAAMINELDRGTPSYAAELSNTVKQETSDMEISHEDVTRIASRIQEMLGSQNLSSSDVSAICGSDTCTDCGHCAERSPDTIRQLVDLGANRFSHSLGGKQVPKDIAGYIDHTALKPDSTTDNIKKLCAEAREYEFASVCIHPCHVPLAAKELAGTNVKVCTVVGFPLGANMPEIKAMETRRAIREGAKEIDMVINIGALKSKDYDLVFRDIRAVTEACEDGAAHSKVIIEAALLNDDEKVKACEICMKARADYVKTSTGFGPGGATEHDVALMAKTVSSRKLGVKAAGGVKDYSDAQKMIAAGATRIGASAGIKIVQGAKGITVSN